MQLREIYQPIKKELSQVEKVIKTSLRSSRYKSILEINNYLLDDSGKRIRPAMLILCAKATLNQRQSVNYPEIKSKLTKVAAAIELIHVASLIHDDVIDNAGLRHNRPTINSRWGQDVSIALGDYLYSVAFELISDCGNSDIIRCVSSATKAMCEGELLQVCERDNLDLLKERYIIIVKKKTAALFAASCQAGCLISSNQKPLQKALKEYGLNFGIAFQIIDDYLDLVAKQENIGKAPGQDIKAGEITLPLLNLMESLPGKERREFERLLASGKVNIDLQRIRERLFDSGAADRTKEATTSFLNLAKEKINRLNNSAYKASLLNLADFIKQRGFRKGGGDNRKKIY